MAKQIELVENISYILQCNALSGTNQLDFAWLKDNVPLSDSAQFKVDKYKTLSTLSFKELKRTHSGRYTCRATNRDGTDSVSSQLLVQGLSLLLTGFCLFGQCCECSAHLVLRPSCGAIVVELVD